jgi:hypothetical protein
MTESILSLGSFFVRNLLGVSMISLYESDFYAWTQKQATLLRSHQWEQVDIENLVEEIETLGRQERRELVNRVGVLLGHLLKWQFQSEKQSNSWRATIREQRRKLTKLLQESPSLKPYLPEALAEAYQDAIDLAIKDTNLPDETFPTSCPYTLEQIFNADFWPGEVTQ